jgi:hypothetical protein
MNSRSLLQPYIRYGDPARTNESNRSCFARIEPYWEDCLISITENLTLPQQKSIRNLLQTFRTIESGLGLQER